MEKTHCPYCGEEILATAKKCKHCGEWLSNSILYQCIIDEATLTISEKSIQYGGVTIPMSALSAVTVQKPQNRWWLPFLLFLIGLALINADPYICLIPFLAGIITLIIEIIKYRTRFVRIYSHSGKYIEIEDNSGKNGEASNAVNVLYKFINRQNLSTSAESQVKNHSVEKTNKGV